MVRHLRTLALGISTEEATFARRGFPTGDARTRERLECAGRSFIVGYLIGLEEGRPDKIAEPLRNIAGEFRGFAYEGAAMAFALLDGLTPWRSSRLTEFMKHPGGGHIYMLHVGAGWAMARLPHLRWRLNAYLARFDPLLRWLVLDGYGFHEGYFRWRRSFEQRLVPARLAAYGRRAFDQGLGRSLWFVAGGDPVRAVDALDRFPAERQADLWSGLGLACAYAGGCTRDTLTYLRDSACGHLPHMQLGAAFAAKARQRAGNPAADTELACEVLCGVSAEQAADITDRALERLAHESSTEDTAAPAYETWRAWVRARFAGVHVEKTPAPAASTALLTASC